MSFTCLWNFATPDARCAPTLDTGAWPRVFGYLQKWTMHVETAAPCAAQHAVGLVRNHPIAKKKKTRCWFNCLRVGTLGVWQGGEEDQVSGGRGWELRADQVERAELHPEGAACFHRSVRAKDFAVANKSCSRLQEVVVNCNVGYLLLGCFGLTAQIWVSVTCMKPQSLYQCAQNSVC